MKSLVRSTFLAALVAGGPTMAFAEEPADVARGAVDPYDAGGERGRFLAAAGVDSELDEREFKANLEATDPFVRKFDSWSTLKAFDKNGNNSIDWFEADGYRRAMRDAVLLAHDKDKDNRLTDAERAAANRQLAAGKTPRIALPGGLAGGAAGGIYDPIDWDTNGNGKFDEEEREAYNKAHQERWAKWQAEYTKKWDTNGDGKVDGEEQTAAQKAQWDEWREKNPEQAAAYDKQQSQWKKQQEEYVRKWDADGDGKLSPDEYKTASEVAMKDWREKNPEQAAAYDKQQEQWKKQQEEYTRKWDADGDGKLNKDEQKAAWDHQAEEGRKQYAEYIRKWDADGDGKLSTDEQKAASEAAMTDWREKNPEAAARWEKQQAEWKKKQEDYVRDFDADGDGKLSPQEWQEVWKVEREKRAKDGGATERLRPFGQ